jgi:hypothetical protein
MTIAPSTLALLETLRGMHLSITFGTQEIGDYDQYVAPGEVAPDHLITFNSEVDGDEFVCPYSDALGQPAECSEHGRSLKAADLIKAHNKIKF